MAYPDDLAPVEYRVKQAVKEILEAIAKPNYRHDMQRVTVHDSGQLVVGDATPAVAIVQVSDVHDKYLTCQAEDRIMTLDLFGQLRLSGSGDQWKEEVSWLIADMRVALAADIKLANTALFSEFGSQDVFESQDSTIFLGKLTLEIAYRQDTLNPTA